MSLEVMTMNEVDEVSGAGYVQLNPSTFGDGYGQLSSTNGSSIYYRPY